jgi:hypothetical protein
MSLFHITITPRARRFLRENGIEDVTFVVNRVPHGGAGRILCEVEPVYQAPPDASGYRYCRAEGYHVFIDRHIRIYGPLTLCAEGIWRLKRLYLNGAAAAVPFWILA